MIKADQNEILTIFQSTPSQRGRQIYDKLTEMRAIISIHALAKRATHTYSNGGGYRRYFNPRPRKEGDQLLILVQCQTWISIHALAKRATKKGKLNFGEVIISIHALAKRATGGGTIPPPLIIISIHALAKRAT